MSGQYSRRKRHRRAHGRAGACLYRRHAAGAGGAVRQALLRSPVCQQHQPHHEGRAVREPPSPEPERAGTRGRRRVDDEGHFGRGRLRGGHAQVHHGGFRYRRGAGGLCGHAVRVRLAAGASVPDLPADLLHLRGADEKTGTARGRGVQESSLRAQHRHARPRTERRYLSNLWL